MTLTLLIPDDIDVGDLSPTEARLDLACAMYVRGALGKVRASELAGVDFFEFQKALGDRRISSYTEEMLEEDLRTANALLGK